MIWLFLFLYFFNKTTCPIPNKPPVPEQSQLQSIVRKKTFLCKQISQGGWEKLCPWGCAEEVQGFGGRQKGSHGRAVWDLPHRAGETQSGISESKPCLETRPEAWGKLVGLWQHWLLSHNGSALYLKSKIQAELACEKAPCRRRVVWALTQPASHRGSGKAKHSLSTSSTSVRTYCARRETAHPCCCACTLGTKGSDVSQNFPLSWLGSICQSTAPCWCQQLPPALSPRSERDLFMIFIPACLTLLLHPCPALHLLVAAAAFGGSPVIFYITKCSVQRDLSKSQAGRNTKLNSRIYNAAILVGPVGQTRGSERERNWSQEHPEFVVSKVI